MTETIHLSAHLAKVASLWRRNRGLAPNRLRPMTEAVRSGSRVFRMNPAVFSLWLLFPMLLTLTSDWIGLLVVFQAMTAAVRLQNSPAAKTLAAVSSMSAAPNRYEGQYHVR